MHKQLLNEVLIKVTIRPDGPILVKSGQDAGADPTLPQMSFVRTRRNGVETVYLPGSSLKGVLRAHCERLARTANMRLSCDPLDEDEDRSCSRVIQSEIDLRKKKGDAALSSAEKYCRSCRVCRLFGNSSVASHLRISDAYPATPPPTEERNGVAIDRVFGSVAVGPFNYETVNVGEFTTHIYMSNVPLAYLGLLLIGLRDLTAGRVRIGFGKSRGLGAITATVDALTLRYPTCEVPNDGTVRLLGAAALPTTMIHGVASVLQILGLAGPTQDYEDYGLPLDDTAPIPTGYAYEPDGWLGAVVKAPAGTVEHPGWHAVGRACAALWKQEAERVKR